MSELEVNNKENTSYFRWLSAWLSKQRGLYLFSFLLLISIPVTVAILLIVVPVVNTPLLPTEASLNSTKPDSIIGNIANRWEGKSLQHIAAKEIEHIVLRNRLALATKDSIYLILNLNDSTLSIEIKGLSVHTARASDIFVSNRITKSEHDALLKWIEQPFTFQQELATIAKTPVLIVDAPKDTSQAAQLPRKPLEPEKDYVHYSLLFDRQLLLEIEQSEQALPEDAALITNYHYRYDTTFGQSFIHKIINPLPSQRPIKIRIRMPQADARTIFRAMPHSEYAKLILIPAYEQH